MKFSQEETSIDNLRALCLRWNRAAAKYAAGSEYVDDPERVFDHISEWIAMSEKVAHRKGMLGTALSEQETAASGPGAKSAGVLGELNSGVSPYAYPTAEEIDGGTAYAEMYSPELNNYVTPLAVQP